MMNMDSLFPFLLDGTSTTFPIQLNVTDMPLIRGAELKGKRHPDIVFKSQLSVIKICL